MKEFDLYKEFEQEFYKELDENIATSDILKEFELEDVVRSNYTQDNMKRL